MKTLLVTFSDNADHQDTLFGMYELIRNKADTTLGPVQVTGTVSIGKDCWIGKNFMVNGNGHVSIGDNCDIAPEVIINTGGHEIGDANRRAGKGVVYNAEIGNGTWVCARSTILQNTRIGNSCIVAACACVISDVEDNTLVGGVPAKLIRRLSEA